jgi:hypothetical protein
LTADTPASFVGKNEGYGYGVRIDRTSDRALYCAPLFDATVSVDTIAFARNRTTSWPEGFERLADVSQFALETAPNANLPFPHEAGEDLRVPGWRRHGDGFSYQLTSEALPNWPARILANCRKTDTDDFLQSRCRATSQIASARIVIDLDLKQTPLNDVAGYFRMVDDFFITLRE